MQPEDKLYANIKEIKNNKDLEGKKHYFLTYGDQYRQIRL